MRHYRSDAKFRGAEPWTYPKTKLFKAVVTDKSFFPKIQAIVSNKAKNGDEGGDNNREDNKDKGAAQ